MKQLTVREQAEEYVKRAGVVESLRLYVEEHVPPGDFLYAVLTNNLQESFARADENNQASMFEIVNYCWNKIPAQCWGSPERVTEWLASAKELAASQVALGYIQSGRPDRAALVLAGTKEG